MMLPSDYDSLKRILKVEDVPDDVRREVSLRTILYHRDGNSGPLRTLALIDAIRFLGYEPHTEEPKPTAVDWRTVPDDGTVRVEARFNGTWMAGSYIGIVEHGTVAVKMDHDEFVRECRPDMVRFEGVEAKIEPEPEKKPTAKRKERKIEAPVAARKVHKEDRNGDPVIDWAAIIPGDKFYAEVDGDYVEAAFISHSGDEVTVSVGLENKVVKKAGLVFAQLAQSQGV